MKYMEEIVGKWQLNLIENIGVLQTDLNIIKYVVKSCSVEQGLNDPICYTLQIYLKELCVWKEIKLSRDSPFKSYLFH